jgi:hypothetical protein
MRSKPSVTARDREHFRLIAETEVRLNRDAIRACGLRDPGQNIEIGLELSEFAASFGADLSRPDEVPLVVLWRERRKRRATGA